MTAPKRTGSSQRSAVKTHAHASLVAKGKDFARKELERSFAGSAIADNVQKYPKFELTELQLGKILGKGGFGTVFEIRSVMADGVKSATANDNNKRRKLSKRLNELDLSMGDISYSEHEAAGSRLFIAQHCLRNNSDSRYALKRLSPEVLEDPGLFMQGMMDMALETRFLSDLEHPNIVKLRAISLVDPFDEQYFLVMDRLYDTLEKRIEKKWALKQKRQSSFFGKAILDRNGKKKDALYEERIVYAYDLAAAINYLHQRNIIYRDLKPENVGFDIRNDIKLFDFGLAKETIESLKVDKYRYKLTEDTGSPRYMAPEVAFGRPYNGTCDTYSFCILLWQMLALKVPFECYTVRLLKERVWGADEKRPQIDEHWPSQIQLLLKKGWSSDWSNRFTMEKAEDILRKECVRVRDGNEEGLEHKRRRSTFVFQANKGSSAAPSSKR